MRRRIRFRQRATALAAVLVVAVLATWALWIEPSRLVITDVPLALTRWPDGRPLKIAVLTDLHVGSPFHGLDTLRAIVDRTNATRPDVICLLGDFVIQGVKGGRFVPPEDIAAELKRLHASGGVVAVLGNHDNWLDHDRVRHALEHVGIPVIEETAVRVTTPAGPVWLAGIGDLWTGRHDIDTALAAVTDDDAPVILLSHNPDIFPTVPARVTLTLAGHTHGGQVRLPLIGRPIVPSRYGQRFAAGHIVENGRHLFVATGTGTSIIPVRFHVPPSVTVLTLTSAADFPPVSRDDR